MVLFMLPAVAFGEVIGPLDVPEAEAWTVPNPIGFLPAEFFGATFDTVWTGGLLFLTAAALAAMIVRFRRAAPTERQQIKWLLFAVSLWAFTYAISAFFEGEIEDASLAGCSSSSR
jgi:hypothetical protein